MINCIGVLFGSLRCIRTPVNYAKCYVKSRLVKVPSSSLVLVGPPKEMVNVDSFQNAQNILEKLTNHPDLYQAIRRMLIRIKLERGVAVKVLQGLLDDERRHNENYKAENRLYLKYVQGIKIRDWIVDLEEEFPQWVSYLRVDRFIKWILALKFVEGPIFDDLRNRLREYNTSEELFANEIHSLHEEMSAIIRHPLSGVPKPTQENIPQVCESISGENEARKAACFILLGSMFGNETPVSTASNIRSSIADTYPTKCFVIITEYNKSYTDAEIGFGKVLKTIENNLEFKNQNCAILENFLVDRSQIGEKREETTLPAIVIQTGFPLNLRVKSREVQKKNFVLCNSVKNAISADLQRLIPQSDGNIFILYEYISHEWFMSFVDSSNTADSTGI